MKQKLVKVEALVAFYIKVPAELDDKQEVYNFLANNVSYTDAFGAVKDDTMEMDEVICIEEEVVDMDWDEVDA